MANVLNNIATATVAGGNVTSKVVSLNNLRGLTLVFQATGISSGNGVFTVDGLVGSVWVLGIPLIDGNVANTNGQNLTRVTSVTISSNTQKAYHLDEFTNFDAIRVNITPTTDGTYNALGSSNKIAVK